MKKLIFFIFLIITVEFLNAQPTKIWSKLVGGATADYCYGLDFFNDTLLLAVGKTNSTTIGNRGSFDALYTTISSNGNLKYIKGYGTTLDEQFNNWAKINDTLAFCAGFTQGSGGDITSSYGGQDGIVMAFNPITNKKLWDKNYGGTDLDQIWDILYVEPGRIIVGGLTKSKDKDFPNRAISLDDAFIGAITETGTKADNLFKVISGSKNETLKRLLKTELRTYLVFGETASSNEGDFLGLTNKGLKDIYIIKANQALGLGNKTMVGGPGDDLFVDAVVLPDFSYIIFANVNTTGGDIGPLKGGRDVWMAKFSMAGKLLWSKVIGGTKDDVPVKASVSDNGSIYLLASSQSNDLDFKGNYGSNDMYLMKLDTAGNILWGKNFGGIQTDKGSALAIDKSGNLYTVGESYSTDKDLTSMNNQTPDLWFMKLFECKTLISNYSPTVCSGDTIVINNKKYYDGKTTGSDTMRGMSLLGCDSVVNISINLKAKVQFTFSDTLCNDASITINNVVFNKDKARQTFNLKTVEECDSTLLVDLNFLPELKTKEVIISKDDGTGSGSIEVIIEGGLPPYKYRWQNGADINKLINQNAGNFNLTVTDGKGCQKSFSFVIGTVSSVVDEKFYLRIIEGLDGVTIQSNYPLKRVEMIDLTGKMIKTENLNSQKEYKIQTKNYPNGLIFINVYNEKNEMRSFQIRN